MSKSYKSGPRFGPNAWTWKDKEKDSTGTKQEVVAEKQVERAPEKKVEQPTPAQKQQEVKVDSKPVAEVVVEQPAVEAPVELVKEVSQDKVVSKKK